MGTASATGYTPIVDAWDFSAFHTVADLGGGGGGLVIAILSAFPAMRGILADRPEFIEKAPERFDKEGLLDRCRLVGADLRQTVPGGADVYLLKHVLHGYDDSAAVEILGHCRSVLPEYGRLLVIEFVLPDVVDRANSELEKRLMSDLNMLVVTGGRERSAGEWTKLLNSAGLECLKIIPVQGDLVSIIEAAAPAGDRSLQATPIPH